MSLSRVKKVASKSPRRMSPEPLESRVLFIATAESLLVNVDATTLADGTPVQTIANTGTLGGVFEAKGGEGTVPVIDQPVPSANGGTVGIRFDGNDFLQHVVAAAGALVPAPAGITGNGTRSVEAWAWNPSIAGEETLLSWGKRGGPDGTNMSFNYGNHNAWGALGQWGAGPDMGWGPTVPAAGQWHHLAYTFDGTTGRVYVDGVLVNSEDFTVNTHSSPTPPVEGTPTLPIQLGAQMQANGTTVEPGLRASLTLARARVHDGVLTPEQILANYNEEKPQFVEPTYPPPPTTVVKLVDLDATNLPTGTLEQAIPNTGTLGGVFESTGVLGTEPTVGQPLPGSTTGTRGLRLDGRDFLQLVSAPGSTTPVAAPASITGYDPFTTIEAWVWNPSLAAEETILSWGKRGGPEGSNMSFNYGHHNDWGAMGHWGPTDMGWGETDPAAGQWHHLAYTYDGTAQRVFVDGVQTAIEPISRGSLNIHAGTPINIGTQINDDGSTPTEDLRGTLTIAKARIYSGALTPEQIAANFAAEKAGFVEPDRVPTGLSAGPWLRYSFNAPAGDAPDETVIEDLVGDRDARVQGAGATFTGSRLVLPGGSSQTAAYVDLPNFVLSDRAVEYGGPGLITIEGWAKNTGNQLWSRYFDFGNSTGGELMGPGGEGAGTQYYMLSQFESDPTRNRTELIIPGGTPANRTMDVAGAPNVDLHFVATWNEHTGEVILYQQGVEVANFNTPLKLNNINDVNAFLGRSNFTGDANFQGEYDEFRIYERILTAQEVAGNFLAGPDVVTNNNSAQVAQVYVKGSAWNTRFLNELAEDGVGTAELGYRVDQLDPAAATSTLPWINTNQVVLVYDRDLAPGGIPAPATYTLDGVRHDYTVTAVTPLGARAVVLTLDRPLGNNPGGAGADGDRVTLSALGGGAGGAAYTKVLNVLQGDANRAGNVVNSFGDLAFVRARLNRSAENEGTGATYTVWADLNASGDINSFVDLAAVRARLNDNLPPVPTGGGASLTPASATDELFSSAPIL